jgi:cell wall-associated NlpC family hydrolase
MSEPSYFDNPVLARKLAVEALSWVGTPFREYYQDQIEAGRAELKQMFPDRPMPDIKGPGGGIDCIGLAQEIFARIGATDPWKFPREPADYQSHRLGDKVLDWLRGRADDTQSKRLAELFVELEIPEEAILADAETPRDFFKPGDVLVMRSGSLFHMPLIYDDDLNFVNALPRMGVVEGTIQDSTYSIHLVAVFRLRP